MKTRTDRENVSNQPTDTNTEKRSGKSKARSKTTSSSQKQTERDKTTSIIDSDDEKGANFYIHMNLLRFINDPGTNMCFSNTAVSCLLNIPEMRVALRNLDTVDVDQNSISGELSKLANMKNGTIASTEKTRSIVKQKCFENMQWTKDFNNNKQHDSGEFIQSLLEHFWNEPEIP